MRFIILLVGFLSLSVAGSAHQPEPLDLSSLVGQVDEVGLATTDSVAALQNRAEDLVTQGNCQEAIPVLEE